VRGEKKTLRSFKGQRVKEASSLRFFLDKKKPPARRQRGHTRGARKKKRERKKRGFLFPTRRSHVVTRSRFSLSIVENKKKRRRRRRVKQSARLFLLRRTLAICLCSVASTLGFFAWPFSSPSSRGRKAHPT